MQMKKLRLYTVLLLCAVICLASVSVGRTYAYFTTYTQAMGGFTVTARDTRTVPNETPGDMSKTISIENVGEVECWARMKLFCGDSFEFQFSFAEDSGWEQGSDGCWYYGRILQPGEKSQEITAKVVFPAGTNKEDVQSEFNVVVITESIPVTYHENGTPVSWSEADWSAAAQEWKKEESAA